MQPALRLVRPVLDGRTPIPRPAARPAAGPGGSPHRDGADAILYRQGQDDRQDWLHRANHLIDARPADERRSPLKAGDIVVTHRGRALAGGALELEVLDLAVAGRPGHPDRLRTEVLPRIAAIYGESAAGAVAEA